MKNYVFVGGSRGIGRVAALQLAREVPGSAFLLVSREQTRGEATVAELRALGAEAQWIEADLSSIAGVSSAGQGIAAWKPALHGLVHSAMEVDLNAKQSLTVDGLDRAYALQFDARARLNTVLVDRLAASGDGRVVHVAAAPPKRLVPDFDDLQFQRRTWRLFASLMSSQVLGHLHAQAAAKHWAHLPVSVSLACVGATKTEIAMTQAWWVRALYALIATTMERSAENVVRYLTAPQRYPGTATLDWKRFTPTPIAYAPELAERAWQLVK